MRLTDGQSWVLGAVSLLVLAALIIGGLGVVGLAGGWAKVVGGFGVLGGSVIGFCPLVIHWSRTTRSRSRRRTAAARRR